MFTRQKRRNDSGKRVGERAYSKSCHLCLVTETAISSDHIIRKWLKEFPDAQDSRTADDHSCIKLFKYFTKLTSNSRKDPVITTHVLDGMRMFQPFGFVAHKENPTLENVVSL